MKKIRTVCGDIDANQLGHVQCHEHLFIEKGIPASIVPSLVIDDYQKTKNEVLRFKGAGGKTIVDAQPAFAGRMADRLQQLAKETNLNILATTGFYKHIFYAKDSYIFNHEEAEITKFYVSEFLDGMISENGNRINAKAGILKGAITEEGLSDPIYKKLFNSLAKAACEVSAPIMIHTDPSADVMNLIQFFKSFGISTNRLLICHLDRTNYNIEYHLQILKTGVYLCYDSVNRLKYVSEEEELSLIKEIIAEGYEDQIVLSLDTTNERLLEYGGYMGLDYILTDFLNIMRHNGISDVAIQKMTTSNATKILSFSE